MFRLFTFLLILLLPTFSLSQSGNSSLESLDKKSRKKFLSAVDCLRKKKDEKSAQKLEKFIIERPDFYPARKELARYYLNTNQTDKAKQQLEYLSDNQATDLQVLGELIDIYEQEKNYDKAIASVEQALLINDIRESTRKDLSRSLEIYQYRKQAMGDPVPFDPEPLSEMVNTKDSEYLPAFNADGSILIYTSRNTSQPRSQEDLFYSIIDTAGTFSKGTPIGELRTTMNEGGHTFSQDGKILIFTSCDRRDSYGGCDLYISFLRDDGWSDPHNLGPEINTRHWESQPSLSADNQTLYFSSTRPGGQGARDIWSSRYKRTGGWEAPKALGAEINTSGNEETPFIHPDNRTLYFQSDGHIGMGGTDIFFAKKEDDQWQKPKNLGYPINDESNQGALFVEVSGNRAYYSKEKKMDNYINYDIYQFDLPEYAKPENTSYIKFLVKDAESQERIKATISLRNLSSGKEKVLSTDQNGYILKTIIAGQYAITIDKDNYIFHSENINIPEQRMATDPLEVVINLSPIKVTVESEEKPKPIVLNNIFFETGSAELLPTSDYELDRLYSLMTENKEMRIKIVGHTDNVGEESDNQLLSENRAKAVYQALVDKGIMSSRIKYEGKGELEPIANNNTEKGRLQNRRTEFYILR